MLLTDGANTRGVTPEEAAEQAAARGVRVYPIGFGTTEPTQMVCTRDQLGGGLFDGPPGGFGGGLGPGGRNFLVVDEEALQTVARTTGGEYFKASDADQLQGVLDDLPKHVDLQERDVEISVAFAGLAALLLLLGLVARRPLDRPPAVTHGSSRARAGLTAHPSGALATRRRGPGGCTAPSRGSDGSGRSGNTRSTQLRARGADCTRRSCASAGWASSSFAPFASERQGRRLGPSRLELRRTAVSRRARARPQRAGPRPGG